LFGGLIFSFVGRTVPKKTPFVKKLLWGFLRPLLQGFSNGGMAFDAGLDEVAEIGFTSNQKLFTDSCKLMRTICLGKFKSKCLAFGAAKVLEFVRDSP